MIVLADVIDRLSIEVLFSASPGADIDYSELFIGINYAITTQKVRFASKNKTTLLFSPSILPKRTSILFLLLKPYFINPYIKQYINVLYYNIICILEELFSLSYDTFCLFTLINSPFVNLFYYFSQ